MTPAQRRDALANGLGQQEIDDQEAEDEKQLAIDCALMAKGKKTYFVYPPETSAGIGATMMKVYTRDDTVHGTDYYLAKDARAIIDQIEREKHYAQDCLDAAKDEIQRLSGEAVVLRGLLKDALAVLETITDEQESDDFEQLAALKGKIKDAITPQIETGELL